MHLLPYTFIELGEWIEKNEPQLYERIKSLEPNGVREALNELTGLEIPVDETVEEGSAEFLKALKKIKAEGKELK